MKDLRFFVLDADDRIVQVGEGSPRSMAGFLGHSLWEYLPQAESFVRPHFDEARQTGHEVEATVFYAGGTLDLRIVPAAENLAVHATRRTELNVRTLGTLAESLRLIEAELAAPKPVRRDRLVGASLQAPP
jgi:hypothetical protein